MNQFKQFGIKPLRKGMIGDKIKMDRILNREITVFDFKIEPSQYTKQCMHLQIGIGQVRHVVFTGSRSLMDLIEQVPREEFPFKTTIVKENERFEFT